METELASGCLCREGFEIGKLEIKFALHFDKRYTKAREYPKCNSKNRKNNFLVVRIDVLCHLNNYYV